MNWLGKAAFIVFVLLFLLLNTCDNRTRVGEVDSSQWAQHIKMPKVQFTPAKQLQIITWHAYLPQEVFDLFTQTYGTEIVPTLVDSNEKMLELLEKAPGRYDLLTPSDYMITKMIGKDLLRSITWANIPNMEYLDEDVRRVNYDRGLRYSVPLFRTSLGIAFNIKYISGIPRTWDFVVEQIRNDYLAHRAGIVSEMRYAMGISLLLLGYSPNSINPEEIAKARDLLINMVQQYGFNLFDSDNDSKKLVNNDALLGIVWNGSAATALKTNREIRFLLPEGKVLITHDSAAISAGSGNAETAELFINYLLIPQVSARMTNFNHFPNCNSFSLPYINGLVRNGPGFLFPEEEDRVFLEDIGENVKLYEEAWAQVLQAKASASLIKLPLPKGGFFHGDSRTAHFNKLFDNYKPTEKNTRP